MDAPSITFDYDPSAILAAWIGASVGSCLLILLFLFPLAGIDTGHPWEAIIGPNDFLLEGSWCIASYFIAAFLAWLVSNKLKRIVPAWIVVSLIGSFLFTFTFWIYLYWNSVRIYSPGSPFRSAPPPFADIVISAAFWSLLYFLVAAIFSLIASLIPASKKAEDSLQLR